MDKENTMRGPEKEGRRDEQVGKSGDKPKRVEPLRPRTGQLDVLRSSRKNGERADRVRRDKRKPAHIEPLHPQTKGKTVHEPIAQIKELFRDVLQTLSDLIWEVDENCTFTWCSGAAEDIFGVSAGELTGKKLFDFMPLEEAQRTKNIIEEIFLKQEPIKYLEAFHDDKQGKRHWLYVNAVPILDNEGALKGYIGVFRDITTQKKAEESLRESELKFKTLVGEAFDGVAIHDGQRIIEVNKAFGELWGYAPGEIAGLRNSELFAPECWETVKTNIQSGYDKPYEAVAIRKDGTRFQVAIAAKTITYKGRTMRIASTRDITERKLLEETLEKERQELNLIIDSSPIIVFYKDKEGRFVRINRAFAEALGIPEKQLLGKTVFDLYSAQIAQAMTKDDREVFRTGRPKLNIIEQYESATGLRWVRTDKIPIFNKNGDLAGLVGFAQDITERKQAEQELRRSEDKFSKAFKAVPAAVTISTIEEGRYIDVNDVFLEITGFKREEVLGRKIEELNIWLNYNKRCQYMEALQKAGSLRNMEFRFRMRNGEIRDFLASSEIIELEGEKCSLNFVLDITERRRAEHKVIEYQKKLKRLAARLTLTEERERRRIARDLHDQVSQSLALVKIQLDALLASEKASPLADTLKETNDTIEKAIQNTRTLTFDLSYPILYELGFVAAVSEWLMEHVQKKHGIKTEFFDDGLPKPLDDDVRVLLFRNVRELLINIIKHARADKVKVSVNKKGDSIKITVEDNGVGLNFEEITASRKGGFGLLSIRESISELGGNFEIDSRPGAGCKAVMTTPLKGKQLTKE